jgi:hypothetical protein
MAVFTTTLGTLIEPKTFSPHYSRDRPHPREVLGA